jgi:hypothetical protein
MYSVGIEPGHGYQQESNGCVLPLMRQHLDVSQSLCVIDGDIGFIIDRATAGNESSYAGYRVPDALRTVLLFGVDVNHFDGPGPLLAAHWLGRLQVPELP